MSVEGGSGWEKLCHRSDLIENSGVCALRGQEQVAIFYLPAEPTQIYAISNRDPIGGANVLSRGIVGDLSGRLVVASPLYKQHFDLVDGRCLEDEEVAVTVFDVRLEGDNVVIRA